MWNLTARDCCYNVCCCIKEEELEGQSQPCRALTVVGNYTFEAVNVFITIIMLAVITARKPMMFIARITLRMMKPGPASLLLVMGCIVGVRLVVRLRKETVDHQPNSYDTAFEDTKSLRI